MTYYERNREKCLQYAREHREQRTAYNRKNEEVFRQYRVNYYQKRKGLESVKQRNKLYYLAHKDKYIKSNLKSRQKQGKPQYDRLQKYYLKCLMKLPDIFIKQQIRNKQKKVVKKPLDMVLTIYFD